MLAGTGRPFGQRLLRAEVVAGREVLAARGEDDHPHVVVGLGPPERLVELDQKGPRLGVLRVGPVEPDPGDAPVVEGLVCHLIGVRHIVHITDDMQAKNPRSGCAGVAYSCDMPAKSDPAELGDVEPIADSTERQARRVVAAYATDADECRVFLSMLGIGPAKLADA